MTEESKPKSHTQEVIYSESLRCQDGCYDFALKGFKCDKGWE